VADPESSLTRLAKPQKAEFTCANEHFWGEHNEVSGLYGQPQSKSDK